MCLPERQIYLLLHPVYTCKDRFRHTINRLKPIWCGDKNGESMKKTFYVLGMGAMLLALAGCTTNYVMTTKSGDVIVSQGKPELDEDTGMMSYTDKAGDRRQINKDDIKEMIAE